MKEVAIVLIFIIFMFFISLTPIAKNMWINKRSGKK